MLSTAVRLSRRFCAPRSLLPVLLLSCAAGSLPGATRWEMSAEKFAPGPLNLPADWKLTGEPGAAPVIVQNTGPDTRFLRLPKEAGPARLLTLSVPALPLRDLAGRLTLAIEIGADAPAAAQVRGLHWFIKKGAFELRADTGGLYLTDSAKVRTPLSAHPPEPGRLALVELVLDPRLSAILSAKVDGVPSPGFKPVAVPKILDAGGLQVIAPTGSKRAVLLRRLAFSDDTAVAGGVSPAALPRWLRPLDPPAESAGTPMPPLPVWTPVADAGNLEFPLDPARLARPPFAGEILLKKADFARLAEILARDPILKNTWDQARINARRLLADGGWNRFSDPEKTGRYTYVVRGILPRLALLHAATGQPDLGRLIRVLTLDLARRPLPFWTHAELRAYEPEAPLGRIENAELARALALSWQWTTDLFSAGENAEIREALLRKGIDPCLRWLEDPKPRNNFMAVIGGGTLAAAGVLGDEAASAKASAVMEQWLGFIEDDGSYGEPVGYFEYGASAFFYGWWALGREEGRARLQRHPVLQRTLPWLAAHYVLHAAPDARTVPWRINFGDDDFTTAASPMVAESLAYAFDDGLGTWIASRLGPSSGDSRQLNIYEFLFRLGSLSDPLPEPVPPAGVAWVPPSPQTHGLSSGPQAPRAPPIAPSAPLPSARIFEAGPAILRSGWTFDRDIVLALRGGGAARTGYSHDRGNRNAFELFVDGELFFAAPGRASYRSALANAWDRRIASHCGISLDDQFQLSDRVARYTAFSDDGNLVQLASEAAGAYRDSPRSVSRRLWLDRARGVIAIEDVVEPSRPSAIGWHLLLANHDGRSVLTAPAAAGEGWRLHRPGGDVVFWVHADRTLAVRDEPGILHTDYSYYPGDPGEGKPGSARHLTWTPAGGPAASLRVWTLILTRAPGAPDARAVFVSSADGPSWDLTQAGRTVPLRFSRVDGLNSRPETMPAPTP